MDDGTGADPGGEPMETAWGAVLWQQFGAAIDMLDNAILACPAALWTERLWPGPPPSYFPPQFGEFWFLAFHTVVWTDLYLTGIPEEEFAPPAPFPKGELDARETLPDRPYTPDEVRTYLASTRRKCESTLVALRDEQAHRPVAYPWSRGQPISYLELQLYNLRHVQEHAAQLSLFLGQHGIPDADLRWVARARAAPSGV
jgi:hypothetical protein